MSDENPKLSGDSTETPKEAHSLSNGDAELDLRSVESARRTMDPEFFAARKYLRNPDFGNAGGEGYVLEMCQDYLLPLLRAKGLELLGESYRQPALDQKLREFAHAEFSRLEEIHWSPARAEFGERTFTREALQRRFESMILMQLERDILPELHKTAVREDAQTKPNGDTARESTTRGRKRGPKPDYESALRVEEIVARVAPVGEWRSRQDDVCEALDEEHISCPKRWRDKDRTCQCWSDCLDRPKVAKAIEYRLGLAKQLKKPTPETLS